MFVERNSMKADNMSAIFSQLICDIRYAGLTRLLHMKVEVHQLPTCQLSCGLLLPPAVGLWPIQGSTPYGATNAYLANFTTNASGDKMIICTQRHSNKNKPPNAPYVMNNSPRYMRSHNHNQSFTCPNAIFP